MRLYRIYELDVNGEVVRPHSFEFQDDADAFSEALALRGSYGAEIWCGARLVGSVPGVVRSLFGSPEERSRKTAEACARAPLHPASKEPD